MPASPNLSSNSDPPNPTVSVNPEAGSPSASPVSSGAPPTAPRNLMGFKDGTANLKLEDTDLLREQLWAAQE
ncbi:hypothetical protein ABZ897_62170, partial [Nonomuraea sp. NPDC046802]|uniref:hypothetical protein n=1 Tax=Nonomuraea sp. NPDC046802 TaxID=3154919 RepID=UPI0033C5EE78